MKNYGILKQKKGFILVEILDSYNHPISPKLLVMRAGNRPDNAIFVPKDSVKKVTMKQALEIIRENYVQISA